MEIPTKSPALIAEIKNAVPSNSIAKGNAWHMKLILNYIMVHAKESLNLVIITTRIHFEIEVMKQNFQSTFDN